MNLVRIASSSAAAAFARPVARYIAHQRDRLKPTATALPPSLKAQLCPYFLNIDLNRARIVQCDPLPIPDPPFSKELRRLGFDFMSPSLVAAITLDHVIAAREPMDAALLFHELVHVVQFRLLGVTPFARLYTRGFLSTRSYEKIPLECCAFELGHRFSVDESPFDVESEVARWIERKLF